MIIYGNTCVVLKLGMGTSDQIQIGSNIYKRTDSLHHAGVIDNVVIISKDWKSKGPVSIEHSPSRMQSSYEKIFANPSQTILSPKRESSTQMRETQRATKLYSEDRRGRTFNILNNSQYNETFICKTV